MKKVVNNYNKGSIKKDNKKNFLALLIIGLVVLGCICSVFLTVWTVSRDTKQASAETVFNKEYELNSLYMPITKGKPNVDISTDFVKGNFYTISNYDMIRLKLTLRLFYDGSSINVFLGAYNSEAMFLDTGILEGNTSSVDFYYNDTHYNEVSLLSTDYDFYPVHLRNTTPVDFVYGFIEPHCNISQESFLWFLKLLR